MSIERPESWRSSASWRSTSTLKRSGKWPARRTRIGPCQRIRRPVRYSPPNSLVNAMRSNWRASTSAEGHAARDCVWPCAPPAMTRNAAAVRARRRISGRLLQMLLEARHQLDEIAGPPAIVELVDEDVVPGILH